METKFLKSYILVHSEQELILLISAFQISQLQTGYLLIQAILNPNMKKVLHCSGQFSVLFLS